MISRFPRYLIDKSDDICVTTLIFSRRSLASISMSISFSCARVQSYAIALSTLGSAIAVARVTVGPSFEVSRTFSRNVLVLVADAETLLPSAELQILRPCRAI